MNIEDKTVRNIEGEERLHHNEGLIIEPNPFPGVLSKLGSIKVKMSDGSIKTLEMNRAERRRFIKLNHLVKVK